MTKKIVAWLALGLCGLFSTPDAEAAPAFEVGYTTFSVTGVICSTGTRSQINATKPGNMGGVVAGYRIQNQDSSAAVWLGGITVTTHTTNGNPTALASLGEKLTSGSNSVWMLGKDYNRGGVPPLVPIYCLAPDGSTSGVVLSVNWFGY